MQTLEQIVDTYAMPTAVVELVRSTRLLLIAGIVGAGKDTVVGSVFDESKYHMIVSHTTRPPRVNHGVLEQDGVDYHFVTLEQIQAMLQSGELVEAKYVHGNVYATSAAELEAAQRAGKIAITDIDIHGVIEYLAVKPDTHAIFLLPPSVESWLKRLEGRYGGIEAHREEVNKRLKTAYDEIAHIRSDKRFVIVINDDLETTVERIESILSGAKDETSEYAEVVTEHLLAYLETHLGTH